MKKIIILGGSGFIGSRLTGELLKSGHEVVIGDIVKSEKYPELWINCDICDKSQLLSVCAGGDTIINLAAEHRDDVRPLSLYEKVNVEGSRLVCEAAAELGIKQIHFTSSVAIYGFPDSPYDEDGPRKPFNEYGRTKLLAEDVYNQWLADDSSRSIFILRPTVVFGEGNRGNVFNLLKQLASGKFMMIGSGKNKKSMAYVGNIVAFLEWGLNVDAGNHTYNYIDKPDFSMNELVANVNGTMERKASSSIKIPFVFGWCGGLFFDIIAGLTGKKFPISRIRVRKFCAETVFSSEKMQTSGFKPPYVLGDALRSTVKHEFVDRIEPPKVSST
ncbi:MAG: NAD-dependent epimerase/dehydratase family protein [Patiriisocius sp.]|uniref:NAD-dependent epimerase/dehydratase family protein n=1 Tax=Patiriisocius sp. TaxID=2822396 RepID=UPI003EF948AE